MKYAKDQYEAKYQLLINQKESTGLKHLNNSKDFIECQNDMGDIYKISNKFTIFKNIKSAKMLLQVNIFRCLTLYFNTVQFI